MNKICLLVVDVQNALIDKKPFDCKNVIENINTLISSCRDNKVEVIYIQHCGAVGGVLERNSEGWRIYKDIEPKEHEMVIEKHYNSSFKETNLKAYLNDNGITEIILTGMQTEYCIDTTCKVAFEFGFSVVVPEKTNTTYDNDKMNAKQIYEHYTFNIVKDRFGIVESMEETLDRIGKTV